MQTPTQNADSKAKKVFIVPVKTNGFDEFLRLNLSAADYLNLETHLGCSPHRVTKLKNDPDIIDMENELPVLARLLCISIEEANKKVKYYALNN